MKNIMVITMMLIGVNLFAQNNNYQVAIDSSKAAAPLSVYGQLLGINELKELKIEVRNKSGQLVIDDVIKIINKAGISFSTFCQGNKYPVNGRQMFHEIQFLDQKTGIYHVTIIEIKTDGSIGASNEFTVRRK